MKSITDVVPDDLPASVGEAELQALAQEALLVRLHELGKIGFRNAALHLDISRRVILTDVIGRYGVYFFHEDMDLKAEAARGRTYSLDHGLHP